MASIQEQREQQRSVTKASVKPNELVSGAYRLNLSAYRLLTLATSKTKHKADAPASIKITAREFGKVFGIDPKLRYSVLAEAANKLQAETYLLASELHKDGVKRVNFTQEVDYIKGEGYIVIVWTDRTRLLLSGINSNFTKIPLKVAKDLHSVFALRLLELCLQFQKTGMRWDNLENLRAMLGVGGKYPEWRDFKRHIDKAINDINEQTQFHITYTTIKTTNNKVVDIKLFIKRHNNKQSSLDL